MMTSWVVNFACVALLMAPTFHADQQLHSSDPAADKTASAASTEDVQFQQRDRRPFDRIGGSSSMGAFQRRAFDRIGGMSGLGGLQKRRFDRIDSVGGSLGSFNKRSNDDAAVDLSAADADSGVGDDEVTRTFDDVEYDKRAFDRIGSFSSLGGLQKRPFDRIGASSSLGGLQRRAFDRIGSASSFDGLSKRPFDRIGSMNSMSGLHKRTAADDDAV